MSLQDLENKMNQIKNEKTTKIIPGNLKSGVEAFGVTGNLLALVGQTKTVTPSTSSQTIEPDNNFNGLTQVTVNPVTASIDQNIQAR